MQKYSHRLDQRYSPIPSKFISQFLQRPRINENGNDEEREGARGLESSFAGF
jgi:hypothetical protein